MIVRYYTEVETSPGQIVGRLVEMADTAMSLGTAVYREGEALYSRIGPAKTLTAKKVEMEFGSPKQTGDLSVFVVAWWATGARLLFPRMDGDLTVAPLGPDCSGLVFQGLYEPPLGSMGRLLDRSLLRRVADSTVKSWVDQLVTDIISR